MCVHLRPTILCEPSVHHPQPQGGLQVLIVNGSNPKSLIDIYRIVPN